MSRSQSVTVFVAAPVLLLLLLDAGCVGAEPATPSPTSQVVPPTPHASTPTRLPETPTPNPSPRSTRTPAPTATATAAAEIVYFTASPMPADPAGTVTLSWEVRGASSVSLLWSDEQYNLIRHSNLPPSGTLTVEIPGIKFYGDHIRFTIGPIDASGQGMRDENDLSIGEHLEVPLKTNMAIRLFNATPDPVERGGTLTLSWDAPNASGVKIYRVSLDLRLEDEARDLPARGSLTLRVPEEYHEHITYFLEAQDANGVILETSTSVGIICRYDPQLARQCPLAQLYIQAAYQPFEGGYMVWRGDTREIYVLPSDARYEVYQDTWQKGDATPVPETPPPGLFQPVRGFGKVWENQPGVREKLGWATAGEISYTMLLEEFRWHWGHYPDTTSFFTVPNGRIVHLHGVVGSWEFVSDSHGSTP